MDMIERGVSDAFCASAKSFDTRGAKILFDETLFEKGKMFSLADGDFEVRINLVKGLLIDMYRVDSKVRVLQLSNNLQHGTLRGSLTLRTNNCENEVRCQIEFAKH